jgi:glycosyltransferase involved in cell wall biosynthesis
MRMQPARPLTLVHVTGESGFSGGEVQLFLLMEGLRKLGHRSVLIGPPAGRGAAEARARGFEVIGVKMRNSASLVAIGRIATTLARLRPDITHLHTGRADRLGSIAAALTGVPCISTRRMDRVVKSGPRTRWLYRRGLRRAVAISNAVERRLRDGGVAPEKTRVIWSAVDPETLEPTRTREAVRQELEVGDAPCVLTLAALVARKGIDVLLDACAQQQQHEARLWIAGEGPERDALTARAQALGLGARVRFLGRREDKADLLNACDVFVLPSRLEGLGVAALEAMAARRPVVASRVGGLADVVADDETGLLVPPNDPASLARALDRLLVDPGLRARLGAAGPKRVTERHLPEQMTDDYVALYREVLEEANP